MSNAQTIYTVQWRSPEVPEWRNSFSTSSPNVARGYEKMLQEAITTEGETRIVTRPAGMR